MAEKRHASRRAKIFQPFDALTGLRKALLQKEEEHDRSTPALLSEEQKEELDRRIRTIQKGTKIEIQFFYAGRRFMKVTHFLYIDAYRKAIVCQDFRLRCKDVLAIRPVPSSDD